MRKIGTYNFVMCVDTFCVRIDALFALFGVISSIPRGLWWVMLRRKCTSLGHARNGHRRLWESISYLHGRGMMAEETYQCLCRNKVWRGLGP